MHGVTNLSRQPHPAGNPAPGRRDHQPDPPLRRDRQHRGPRGWGGQPHRPRVETAIRRQQHEQAAASTADGKAAAAQTTANNALSKTVTSEQEMAGVIKFAANQTFPGAEGDVQSVNAVTPGVDGNITLSAADVESVSAKSVGV